MISLSELRIAFDSYARWLASESRRHSYRLAFRILRNTLNSHQTTPFDLGQQIMWWTRRIFICAGVIAFLLYPGTSDCAAEQQGSAFGQSPAAVQTSQPTLAASPSFQPPGGALLEEMESFFQCYGWAVKLVICTVIIFGTCLALVFWRKRWFRVPTLGKAHQRLRIVDSMAIAPGVNLKLIHVGSQRVLVGHDRHGLKELLLIHQNFEEFVASADRDQGRSRISDYSHEDFELTTFANPKDHGWALNRSTI